MVDARWSVRRVYRQRRHHALLRGVPGGLYRAISLEPRRGLDRLLGLAARGGRELAIGWWTSGPARAAPSASDRWQPPGCRPHRQRHDLGALAKRAALRHHHDVRSELPRAGGIRAAALAPFRATPRHGDLDRSVGQRLWARCIRTARPAIDLDDRLARDLPCPGGLSHGLGSVDRRSLSARGPAPGPERARFTRDRPGSDKPAVGELDLGRGDADAAFLASLRGLPVHRARQLSRVVAPARLCGRYRLRQALRRWSAGHRQLPCDRRNDPYRQPVGLYRARVVGDPCLWHLDHRGHLRTADHQSRAALAIMAACLLLWPDLGCERPGDHRQDRRSLPGGPARDDPRRYYD